MQKAYIILAHKYPTHLRRLITALTDGNSDFFVHIDKKSNIDLFKKYLSKSEIYWVERIEANWAEFSLVEATLNGLKAIRQAHKIYDRVILLSGQDYPIKSNRLIDEYLKSTPYSNFLEYHSLPDNVKWNPNGGMYRVNKYFMGFKGYQRYVAKSLNLLAMVVPFLERKIPQGMKPFAGSAWWIIDAYSLNYILDFVDNNPEYLNFHKKTFAPDELFFHMILLNATDKKVKESILNTDKRFILWKDKEASHPEDISEENIEQLEKSDALFARKFNITQDIEVLNLIDRKRSHESIERNASS